jgi:hypothetical protein
LEIRYGDIVIRPLKEEDKYLLMKWLSDPVVLQYYEGRDCPFTLEKVEDELFAQSEEAFRCIFIFAGKKIGYVQYYPIDEEERTKYGYSHSNEVIYGTDQFIGEPGSRHHVDKCIEEIFGRRDGSEPSCHGSHGVE